MAADAACVSSMTPRSLRHGGVRGRRTPKPTAALRQRDALPRESVLVPARHHVEIQCPLRHPRERASHLGERECSIQRRHQKLVEESPSPALTPELREQMEAASERACRSVGYVNAGTFEYLLGPDGSFSFIELNACLQVEHPVTELLTGVDPVRRQLEIAAGERLELTGRAPRRGHAIEIRLNAEDPARDFMPSPGTVTRFRPPLGPGIRVDTFVEDATTISPYYDSLIAKLVAWDENRPAAIERAERMLRSSSSKAFRLRVSLRSRFSRATSSGAATTRPRPSPSLGPWQHDPRAATESGTVSIPTPSSGSLSVQPKASTGIWVAAPADDRPRHPRRPVVGCSRARRGARRSGRARRSR